MKRLNSRSEPAFESRKTTAFVLILLLIIAFLPGVSYARPVRDFNYQSAWAPSIKLTQPDDIAVAIGQIATLRVEVKAPGDLAFEYQWYSSPTGSNIGGTVMTGETRNEFNAPTILAGTSYYYCIVKIVGVSSTRASRVAKVTVTAADGSIPPNSAEVEVEGAEMPASDQLTTAEKNALHALLDPILSNFDQNIGGGKLIGNFDDNKSAKNSSNKISAFRNKLVGLQKKIDTGEIEPFINNLSAAITFIDGKPSPKDLVIGTYADDIEEKLTIVMTLAETMR